MGVSFAETCSLFDCAGRALVDTCSALNALVFVNDCEVIDGDCVLGADVCACSASDTLALLDRKSVV